MASDTGTQNTDGLLWTEESDQESLDHIVQKLLPFLLADDPFCLWLIGPLGAGKTAIAGKLLHAMGLAATVRVTSPTYTYVQEYRVGGAWIAHLDLYRAGADFSAEDIGLVDSRSYRGYLVEWPQAVPATPVLQPSLRLEIDFIREGAARRYRLFRKAA